MTNKQKILTEVYEHLRMYHGVHTQEDFANQMDYSRTAITLALNGNENYLTNKLFKNIGKQYKGVFNPEYLEKGEGDLLTEDEKDRINNGNKKQTAEIPEYVKRLCDEAARLATRNEILERQCESLIAELRDTKDKNESFLSELRKSKEFNDAMVADLRIAREQNKALISELRETKKNNDALSAKLETAINGIEGMKNQIEMMASLYTTPQPSTFAPAFANDQIMFPEGLIRGGHPAVTDEIVKKANKALNKKTKRT